MVDIVNQGRRNLRYAIIGMRNSVVVVIRDQALQIVCEYLVAVLRLPECVRRHFMAEPCQGCGGDGGYTAAERVACHD